MRRCFTLSSFLTLLSVALLFTLVVALPFVMADTNQTNQLTIDKQSLILGDHVLLLVNTTGLAEPELHITSENATYRYSGTYDQPIVFTPDAPGMYAATLIDHLDDTVFDQVTFIVIAPIQNTTTTNLTLNVTTNTTNITTNITILPTESNQAPAIVTTDQTTYTLAEQVIITVQNAPQGSNLNINTPTGSLHYLGNLTQSVVFTPTTPGNYTAELRNAILAPLATAYFTVQEQPSLADTITDESMSTTEAPPNTSPNQSPTPTTLPATEDPFTHAFHQTSQRITIRAPDGQIMNGTIRVLANQSTSTLGTFAQLLFGAPVPSDATPLLKAQNLDLPDGSDVEFVPTNQEVVKAAVIHGLVGGTIDLGLAPVLFAPDAPPPGHDQNTALWTNLFAVDPTALNATNVTLTVTAQGTELYKCRDWNFTAQTCTGDWIKVQDLVPNENYTVTVDSADPGYGESIPIPSAGWVKLMNTATTGWNGITPGTDLGTVMICKNAACTQTATNFQPGDFVNITVNSSNGRIPYQQSNQIDIYDGGEPSSIATYSYTTCLTGDSTTGEYAYCQLNFTIPSNWNGWYYIDSDEHRLTGNRYFEWKTPFTVGQEPVDGDKLEFFADSNLTRPADKFGPGQAVYVFWDPGITNWSLSTQYSNASIKTFHYSPLNAGGITVINNNSITWTNQTGPYIFNFTMPTTLSDGYGDWYYFEPDLYYNSTDNIPDGAQVYGRMIMYQNNTAPNTTNATTNSPVGSLISVGQLLQFNTTFNDTDEIDQHILYICTTNGMSFQACSMYTSNSTCVSGACSWISSGQLTTVNFTSSGNWTVPYGVSSVEVEVFGAGGAGGGCGTTTGQAGGGGGGAEAMSIINVTPGATYNVTVGAGGVGGGGDGPAGGASNFTNSTNTSIVFAMGGCGGLFNGTGGCGGNSTGSIGQIILSGGIGGNAPAGTAGGGGGGAGNNTAGGNASGGTPGTGGTLYGGNGGNGTSVINSNGNPGSNYGGGGSGARRTGGNRLGGSGARGLVILVYTPFVCNGTPINSCTNATICANTTWTLASNLTCAISANRTLSSNNTGYAFVCDPWSCSAGYNVTFGVYNDSQAPNVTLAMATPYTATNFTVTLLYNATDDYGLANCNLYTNVNGWQSVMTNTSVINSSLSGFTYTFPGEGSYLWNVQCYDYAGNNAFAPLNYTVSVTGPPIVNLITPLNGTYSQVSLINFTYNVTYHDTIDTCYLLVNGTAVANNTNIVVNVTNNFLYNLGADGQYNWNVECDATDGTISDGDGVNNSGVPRIITVDSVSPTVTLLSPNNSATINSSTITFIYNASSPTGLTNCTLYVDGAPIGTTTSITNGANVTTQFIMGYGSHYWYATCYDYAGNQGTSSTWSVNVNVSLANGTTLYETDLGANTNYATTVYINLSTSIDGTQNQASFGTAGKNMAKYTDSIYIPWQSNGVLIYPNSTVTFSSQFSAGTANEGYITWKFYKNQGGIQTLICQSGNDYTSGTLVNATGAANYASTCTSPLTNTAFLPNKTVSSWWTCTTIMTREPRSRTCGTTSAPTSCSTSLDSASST